MKKKNFLFGLITLSVFFVVSCGKKQTLSEQVTLKQEEIEIGQDIKLEELFSYADGIKIGIKNSNDFNVNKAGTYAVEVVIDKNDEQETKSYMVKVVDKTAPEIKLTKKAITIYEGSSFKANKYVKVTDNSGEKIKAEYDEKSVNCKKAGVYTVKYTAKDSSGNESNEELKVTVKKNYSYKEMVKIIKKLLKKKKYSRLVMDQDTTKKIIYIEFKNKYNVPAIVVKNGLFQMEPYISFSKEKNTWCGNYIITGFIISPDEYVKPGRCYLTSANGKESSNGWSYETEYLSSFVQCYDVEFQYIFKKEQTAKLSKILSGKKITAVNYEDVVNTKYVYKYKNNEITSLHQLASFCNEISNFF